MSENCDELSDVYPASIDTLETVIGHTIYDTLMLLLQTIILCGQQQYYLANSETLSSL